MQHNRVGRRAATWPQNRPIPAVLVKSDAAARSAWRLFVSALQAVENPLQLRSTIDWRSWECRYTLAVAAVGVATASRFWLSGFLQHQPFPTFLFAILLVAVSAGPGPVLLTTFLSGLSAVQFFMEPEGALATGNLIRLSVFMVIGLSVAALTKAMGRAREAELDAKVSLAEFAERKRAHEALRESEEKFASFMHHLPGLAWIKDTSGRYSFVNDAAVRAFHRPREEIYGKTDREIFDEETAAQFRVNDQKALASDTGLVAVETLRHDDGVFHHSLVSKFAIRDARQVVRAIGGVAIDVTERVQMEERLKEATERLVEADRRKDEFIAMLAHELRNPLTPIFNAIYVLRRDASAAGGKERELALLSMMDRQVQSLVRLVDDLLDVSRITRGKIKLKKQRIDLANALRNAVEAERPAIEQAGIDFHVTLPSEPLMVDVDPVRLAQVFTNLFNNAAKYTQRGGAISLTAERCGEEAVITVCDTGVGIPTEMLPRVFDLFTQVDRSIGHAQGGLGIGLALVKSLLELHGGSVEAHSEGPGKGSAFVVRLPLPPRGRTGMDQDTPADAFHATRRILVIDDNLDVANSLAMLLETFGACVRVANGGAEGLALLGEFRPELVFLDLGMPQMDGYETARRIRARPEGADVTLVALTGLGKEQILDRVREAGFTCQITKPAGLDALRHLLAD